MLFLESSLQALLLGNTRQYLVNLVLHLLLYLRPIGLSLALSDKVFNLYEIYLDFSADTLG